MLRTYFVALFLAVAALLLGRLWVPAISLWLIGSGVGLLLTMTRRA